MIVRRPLLPEVVAELAQSSVLALDTETSGLRPYQGDRAFALIMSAGAQSFYFNFNDNAEELDERLDRKEVFAALAPVFADPTKTWRIHNAKFDMGILHQEGVELAGEIHCTEALARVLYNAHMSYELSACAARIGLKKDERVEDYIDEHHLWKWVQIPGKKVRSKDKFFSQVPFAIMREYGENDGDLHYRLGESQEKALEESVRNAPAGAPNPKLVWENEKRFTKTCFEMERQGILIDPVYCEKAAAYETQRAKQAAEEFERLTGTPFKDSNKVLAEAFTRLGEKFPLTEKGNPSFESDVLSEFNSPVARVVLDFRDARSHANYYYGFLWFKDAENRIHPNLRQSGTKTGRISAQNPNFQNLTKEEDEEENAEKDYLVRRAIVPTPGFFFACPDYDQVEYRLMLDYAAAGVGHATELVKKVLSGLNVHEATSQVATEAGSPITYAQAKTTNFLTLYGGGDETLAKRLSCPLERARQIRQAIFRAAPEIKQLIRRVIDSAQRRGYIFNCMGRRSYFPDSNFAYKAPNYLIQGGSADIIKAAMNEISAMLKGRKSRMILQIHDELLFEIHESEAQLLSPIQQIMENIYPYKYVPLTVGMDHAVKSWGDKIGGYPGGAEA